ncbi:MAG: LpxI family protein, partial [Akkermansia muciniphila]
MPLCDAYQEFSVGQINKPFTFLKKHGVRNVIMAGGINPKNILSLRPDLRALSVLMRMPEKNADSLLGAVITEAEKEGFTILPASTYMEEHMPQPGHIAGPPPTPEQWEDARFGMQTAKEISRLHIGQSVIVHGGTVIAVEAIEGTN